MPSYNRQGLILSPSKENTLPGYIPLDDNSTLDTNNILGFADADIPDGGGASILESTGAVLSDEVDDDVLYISAVNPFEFIQYFRENVGVLTQRKDSWRAIAMIPWTWRQPGGLIVESRINPSLMNDTTAYALRMTVANALENGDDFIATVDYSNASVKLPGVFRRRENGYDILAVAPPTVKGAYALLNTNIGSNSGFENFKGKHAYFEITASGSGGARTWTRILPLLPTINETAFWYEIESTTVSFDGAGFNVGGLQSVSTISVTFKCEYNPELMSQDSFVEINVGEGAPTRYNIESLEIVDSGQSMLVTVNAELGGQ